MALIPVTQGPLRLAPKILVSVFPFSVSLHYAWEELKSLLHSGLGEQTLNSAQENAGNANPGARETKVSWEVWGQGRRHVHLCL